MSYITSKNVAETTNINNWVQVDSKSFNNISPSGSFNISSSQKFMIEIESTNCSADIMMIFGSDNGDNYITQIITSSNDNVSGARYTQTGFNVGIVNTPMFKTIIFDKKTKTGYGTIAASNSVNFIRNETYYYSGSAAMDILNIASNYASFSGKITIYEWQDVNSVDLHTWEEIKTIYANNQTIDETILIDGDVDPYLYIEVDGICKSSGLTPLIQFNSDSQNNYCYGALYQKGNSSLSSGSTSYSGIIFSSLSAVINRREFTRTFINLTTGNYKFCESSTSYYLPDQITQMCQRISSCWKNTTKVTSIRILFRSSILGSVKIFKRAQSHLLTTNPNINSTVFKKIDGDTVQIQPGEIEINGIVCNIISKKDISLIDNLKSGLTKTANTNYYLYAIKQSNRSCVYLFDTQEPLRDRYNNLVSNFGACNAERAWFHPVYGLNYRFVKQIVTDTDNNIIDFDDYSPTQQLSGHYILKDGISISNRNSLNFIGFNIENNIETDTIDISLDSPEGHKIQNDGTVLTTRSNLNFSGFNITDDGVNDAIKVGIPEFTKGHTIQSAGISAINRTKLNFVDFISTDDPTNDATKITLPTIFKINSYKDKFLNLGTQSSSFTIDVTAAVIQKVTIGASCIISFSGWDTTGYSTSVVLSIVNGGAYTTTFSGVKWANGTAPVLSSSGTDRIVFVCDDGSTIYGFVAGLNIY